MAEKLGLCGPNGDHKVAHVEETDPALIIEALAMLRVRRLDHGIRALEDPHLVQFLAANQIPLTVCPNSNERLKVLERWCEGKHVVRKLIDAGLMVTINSDDPAFCQEYINYNFAMVAEEYGDMEEEHVRKVLVELAKNSFRASFLTEEEKTAYLELFNDIQVGQIISYR